MKNFNNLSEDAKAIVASNLTVAYYLLLVKEQIRVGVKLEPGESKMDGIPEYYSQMFDLLEHS